MSDVVYRISFCWDGKDSDCQKEKEETRKKSNSYSKRVESKEKKEIDVFTIITKWLIITLEKITKDEWSIGYCSTK